MTVQALLDAIGGKAYTTGSLLRQITCGYTCDLLSWVMANGAPGMAWVTVQTHLNVVAVAQLSDMACVILPEGISPEEGMLAKANAEGIAILGSDLSAYALCGRMSALGIPAQ